MRMLSLAAAAAAVLSWAIPAAAAPLSGVFEIDIYNYDSGGASDAAAATAGNVDARAAYFIATILYDGALDFRTDTRRGAAGGAPLISDFLATGSGRYTVSNGAIGGVILSTGQGSSTARFGLTTLFDIEALAFDKPFRRGFSGVIRHDDGMTLREDGGLIAGHSAPTAARTTQYAFGGGDFRLIYTSANGDPSLLEVHADLTPIPLPAPALMLVTACIALGWVARRRMA